MRVAFAYPSTGLATGGEVVIYEFANALSRRGVEVVFLHGPATPTRIADPSQLPALCHRDDVRHVVVDDLADPALPACDLVAASGLPERLGLPFTFIQGHRMLSEEWERAAFRSPGPKVCVAGWLRDIGRTYGVPPHRLWHVPPGIDHHVFVAPPGPDDRHVDVAVLHHPFPEKGWTTARRMLEVLLTRRPGLRCVVFGRVDPGPLPVGVEFVASPDHARLVREVYGDTRVFVQTSRNEGFGLTPLEAMACGAALVSTDCGGSRDYALPGRTADVVAVDDVDALVTAVLELLDDTDRRRRYAAAGTELARTFDWDRSGERLAELLRGYLDDPEPMLTAPGPDRPELRQER